MMLPLDFIGTLTDSVGGFLPKLGAALAVLIGGLILSRYICKAVAKALSAAGVDKLGERLGITDSFAKFGLGDSLSALITKILRLMLVIVVVIIAVGLLGVSSLQQTVNEALLFIPRLIVAIAILALAVGIGGWALGLVAAGQIGIPTQILVVMVAVALGGCALAAALAFGLGSVGVTRQISAGRYLGSVYRPGQRLRIGDLEGTVVSLDSTACVLDTGDGKTVRVPNHELLESTVSVLPDGGGAANG
jgi:small-conductance mechanosensitive channel